MNKLPLFLQRTLIWLAVLLLITVVVLSSLLAPSLTASQPSADLQSSSLARATLEVPVCDGGTAGWTGASVCPIIPTPVPD